MSEVTVESFELVAKINLDRLLILYYIKFKIGPKDT